MRLLQRILAIIVVMMVCAGGAFASSTPSKGGGDLIVGGPTPTPTPRPVTTPRPGTSPTPYFDPHDPDGMRLAWVTAINPTDWEGRALITSKQWITDWLLFIIDYPKMNRVPPAVITQEYANILAFLRESGLPIIEYFSAELQSNRVHAPAISSFYPAGFDLQTLVMYEYWPLGDYGYEIPFGNVRATWQFPTEYKVGQLMNVVVGIMQFGSPNPPIVYPRIQPVQWYPLKAEVIQYGNGTAVQVYFTVEVLELLLRYREDPACIAILSEPFN